MLNQLPAPRPFTHRHLGAAGDELLPLLEKVGASSLDELVEQTVPSAIRRPDALNLPEAISEHELLDVMNSLAEQNQVFRSYIGMGYAGTLVPPVIQRNILENPAWYTQYTTLPS
jgi:Glycine cleavage system protein P (pyridoxal-binding), N-terminal domain